jgi:hypothetical protein
VQQVEVVVLILVDKMEVRVVVGLIMQEMVEMENHPFLILDGLTLDNI